MTKPYEEQPAILVVIGEEDKSYVSRLGPALAGVRSKVFSGEVLTIYALVALAKRNGLNAIITTREDVLKKLLPAGREKKAKLSNYSGSIIPYGDVEFLILDPLKQLVTVKYGDFLARRYISKITKRATWKRNSIFDWKLIDSAGSFDAARSFLETCHIIGVDIETWAPNLVRCIGYCGVRINAKTGARKSMAFVIPIAQLSSMQSVLWMRALNSLEVPKVLQNGKYDIAILAAWNAPLWGYFYDTVNAFHSWLSELPKDLASIVPFFVRNSMYWKDLAEDNDPTVYYRYNALDCWGTAESFLTWMEEAPAWAKRNYVMEFSTVPACHMMELTGIKRDQAKLEQYAAEYESRMDKILVRLKKMISPNFNPSSPIQVLKLLHILGYKKAESSDEKTIEEASYFHPLNDHILGSILEYRGLRKLISTYLAVGESAKEWRGRILFSINPHGTDTLRKSSREFHYFRPKQSKTVKASDL